MDILDIATGTQDIDLCNQYFTDHAIYSGSMSTAGKSGVFSIQREQIQLPFASFLRPKFRNAQGGFNRRRRRDQHQIHPWSLRFRGKDWESGGSGMGPSDPGESIETAKSSLHCLQIQDPPVGQQELQTSLLFVNRG